MPKELCACGQNFGKDKQMVITIKTCYKKHLGKEGLVSVSFRDVLSEDKADNSRGKEDEKKESKEALPATDTRPSPIEETESKHNQNAGSPESEPQPSPVESKHNQNAGSPESETQPSPIESKYNQNAESPESETQPSPVKSEGNQNTELPEALLVNQEPFQTQSEFVQTESKPNLPSVGKSMELTLIDYEAFPEKKPSSIPSRTEPEPSSNTPVTLEVNKQEDLKPNVYGREDLKPVPNRKEQPQQPLPKRNTDAPEGLPKLPTIPKRYHGPGCALEISLMEKHGEYCNYRKGANPARDPADDRSGSYEAIGRMTFRTCTPQMEPMVLFYSFADRLREGLDDGTPRSGSEGDEPEVSIMEEMVRQTMWDPLTKNTKTFDLGKGGWNTKCEDCKEKCSCKKECGCKAIEELYVRKYSRDESSQTGTTIITARRGRGWRWVRFLLPCVFQSQ